MCVMVYLLCTPHRVLDSLRFPLLPTMLASHALRQHHESISGQARCITGTGTKSGTDFSIKSSVHYLKIPQTILMGRSTDYSRQPTKSNVSKIPPYKSSRHADDDKISIQRLTTPQIPCSKNSIDPTSNNNTFNGRYR